MNSNSNGDATRVFMEHIKQVITTIPPITKFSIIIPIVVLLFDIFTFTILQLFSTSYWTFLDVDLILYQWQIQRLVLYPISSRGLIEVLITSLWLFPEIYKAEKKMGSIRLLWVLFSLLTITPAITYMCIIELVKYYAPDMNLSNIGYFGMGGWVVGLVVANYLKDDDENNQRMIAGVISIPNKVWPAIVLLFFVILAPGASFVLNLTTACFAFLYGQDKLPSYFTPSEETISYYEEKMQFITKLPNFVSNDSRGVYLPIFNHSPYSSNNNNVEPSTSSPNFPGTGVRLGS